MTGGSEVMNVYLWSEQGLPLGTFITPHFTGEPLFFSQIQQPFGGNSTLSALLGLAAGIRNRVPLQD